MPAATLADVLTADDEIDWAPRRIAIAGVTGAGKTTLARRIASATGIAYTEVDSLFHGPLWQPLDTFEDEVRALVARPAWVAEWQYAQGRPLIAARADTLVWLDLPSRVTLSRVVRRTIRRRIHRERLWNDNLEPPLHTFFVDPDHIVRWAIRTQRKLVTRVPETEAAHPQLHVVRLRSQREVDRWLAALVAASADQPGASEPSAATSSPSGPNANMPSAASAADSADVVRRQADGPSA